MKTNMELVTTNNPHLRWLKLWLSLGGLLIVAIIVFSLIPPPDSKKVPLFLFPFGDKIAHFIAYFSLMSWFSQIYHRKLQRIYLIIWFILLGILLEILQKLGGVRTFDLIDILANTIGILSAWRLAQTRFSCTFVRIEQYFLKIFQLTKK